MKNIKIEVNNVYEMDALLGASLLEDNSVDLIVIDPPYNIGKDTWDKIDNYIDWMINVLKECERVLKPTGSLYYFHNDFEVISEIQYILKRKSDFVFRNLLIWNKKFEGCKSEAYMNIAISTNKNRTYRKFSEYCLFYTFKDVPDLDYSHIQLDVYKPIREYFRSSLSKAGVSWNDPLIVKMFQDNGFGKTYANARQISQNKLNPNYAQFRLFSEKEYDFVNEVVKFDKTYSELFTWWSDLNNKYREERARYKKENKNTLSKARYTFNKQKNHCVINYQTPEDKLHICEKPIDMIQDIILTSSNEGDVVLDLFMGSGTTALACKKTKRKYIGFEKEKKYIETIKNRLS